MKINWRAGCWETSTSGSMGGGWKSTGYPTDTWQLAGRLPDGLHLSDTLLTWRGPALIVDPKGEQLERTGYFRQQFGPVYCLPGHQVNLAAYYHHLLDRDDIAELHTHLIRPWASRETIFAEKAMSLFTAAGLYGEAKGLDPIRVLMDMAESDPEEVLAALEKVPACKRHVRVFTNGAAPHTYREDKFVTSAFGNFTTRLMTYQKHLDTIAPSDSRLVIPPDWVSQNSTVYITYSLTDLQGVGGVVAAIIAAMLRYQMQKGRKERLLVAIDELPAIGLRNITSYLATCGGYGITLLLYAQSIAQLTGLYGQDETKAILSNCAHTVWYPPADTETAETMSKLYGQTLKANPVHSTSQGARQQRDPGGQTNIQTNSHQGASWSWQERPAMLPSQMMALPAGQVLVTTQAGQRYVFLGRRLNPIPLFSRLPGPAALGLPRPHYGERVYTQWIEAAPTQPRPPADDPPPADPAPSPAGDGPPRAGDGPLPANAALPPEEDTPPPTGHVPLLVGNAPPSDAAPSSDEPLSPATDTSTDVAAGSQPQPPAGDDDAPSGKNTF